MSFEQQKWKKEKLCFFQANMLQFHTQKVIFRHDTTKGRHIFCLYPWKQIYRNYSNKDEIGPGLLSEI